MKSRFTSRERDAFLRSLWRRPTEPSDWPDEDLVEVILDRYAPSEVPPCRVCGRPLTISSIGGGEPTRWGCSGLIPDPDNPGTPDKSGKMIWAEGRTVADEHYSKSIWEDRRRGGDEVVIELLGRYAEKLAEGSPVSR